MPLLNLSLAAFGIMGAALTLLAGLLILIFPKILNYVIALYLIVLGIIQLLPYF